LKHLGRDGRARHELAERRELQVGEAGAQLALGQDEVPEPALACLDLELLQDGQHLPAGRPGVELLLGLSVLRQAEHALGQDVAEDLGRSGPDAARLREQLVERPLPAV
jgi:hypothetical protein